MDHYRDSARIPFRLDKDRDNYKSVLLDKINDIKRAIPTVSDRRRTLGRRELARIDLSMKSGTELHNRDYVRFFMRCDDLYMIGYSTSTNGRRYGQIREMLDPGDKLTVIEGSKSIGFGYSYSGKWGKMVNFNYKKVVDAFKNLIILDKPKLTENEKECLKESMEVFFVFVAEAARNDWFADRVAKVMKGGGKSVIKDIGQEYVKTHFHQWGTFSETSRKCHPQESRDFEQPVSRELWQRRDNALFNDLKTKDAIRACERILRMKKLTVDDFDRNGNVNFRYEIPTNRA